MKLKWYEYVSVFFEALALIVKFGSLKKARSYLEKEHDRLKKEREKRIAGLELQIETELFKALIRVANARVDLGQWEKKLMKLEGVELRVCLKEFMLEVLDSIIAQSEVMVENPKQSKWEKGKVYRYEFLSRFESDENN